MLQFTETHVYFLFFIFIFDVHNIFTKQNLCGKFIYSQDGMECGFGG